MLYAAFSPRAFRMTPMTGFLIGDGGRAIPMKSPPGCVYAREDGAEVIITCVSSTPEDHAAYLAAWDDAEDRGIVATYVRAASGADLIT